MTEDGVIQGSAGRGSDLGAIALTVLTPEHRQMLERAGEQSGGSLSWRRRKAAEARDLLSLAQIAPPGRLAVDFLDMRQALRAIVRLEVAVATRPEPGGPVIVQRGAVLGLTYPEELLQQPLPGAALVQILAPRHSWHPNASSGPIQRLCLGATIGVGIPLVEITLRSYGALAMQSVTVEPSDPAGVMNHEAALYWSENLDRTPLSTTPFLRPGDREG